jgi:hypothetical protein
MEFLALEYVGQYLSGKDAGAYPLSNSKIQCSLLFRERGVVADEKVGSWQSDRQNTPKTMIRGRSLARTASQSVLMRNTATVWYGGATGLGRGKQDCTH